MHQGSVRMSSSSPSHDDPMTTKEKSVSKVGKDDIKNIGEPFRLGWRFCAFSILCASALSSSTGRMCRSELERPLSPSHPLFGLHEIFGIKSDSSLKLDTELVTSRIIAMGTSRDDVVEVLPDGSTSKYHGTTRTLYSTELSSQPTVEHLLVDVAKLDVSFLKSQKETGHIVTQIASSSGLALLSYQCHELQPSGHACIGIMSDSSHITLRTWPEHGVMSLDLFAGKKIDMLELISFMEELLREHQSDSLEGKETPRINWITKRRGFQRSIGHRNSTDVSSNTLLQRPMSFEMKQKVAFVETQYQRAEIFDVIEERFERSPTHCTGLNDSGFVSYCIKHPELFRPDRILYLDGIMKSRVYGEAAYHEALVHPSMFAHENPKRVAIIGGGDGATLREVLKHKTVERVTMLEIDEQMVNVSRTFLPEWSDCSNIQGSAKSCFEDPRAEVVYTDAITWFIERFGGGKQIAEEDKYDVIIMDALKPISTVPPDILFQSKTLAGSINNSLASMGIFVAKAGEDSSFTDLPDGLSDDGALVLKLEQLLEGEGFARMVRYSDAHANIHASLSFLTAWKDIESSELWYASQADVDQRIRRRTLPPNDGVNSLRYFDGATMMSYQYPSRLVEEVFCRRSPTPPLCHAGHGMDPEIPNASINSFEVKMSEIPNAGRGVHFKEAVPANSFIAVEESVHDLVVYPPQKRLLKTTSVASNVKELFKAFEFYLFGYGFASDFYGDAAYSVDMSILTFINHGCNGKYVMGETYSVTEMTADPKKPPPDFEDSPFENSFYNPVAVRNVYMFMNGADTTLRDVAAGEELLDNYLRYLFEDSWEWGVNSYRRQCSGQAGVITDYENSEVPLEPII